MTKQLKADLSLLSITIVWGSSFILMKNITGHIPTYAYLFLRFSVASLVLAAIFHKQLKSIRFSTFWKGSVIGLFLFGVMALQFTGLQFTSASNSAFITGLNVVMVPVVSALLLKKRPPFKAVAGVALATVGLMLLSGGFSGAWNKGDTLTLFCAICCAFQIIFIDKFASEEDTRLLAFIQIAVAALLYGVLWAITGAAGEPGVIHMNSRVIITILITGVLGTAFAFGVQTIAQKYTTPTRTALILTCEPVFGAVFAMTIPNELGQTEVLTMASAVGCLLILFGMLVTEIKND